MILCLPPFNLSPEEALAETPHGLRHLYPEASRQLVSKFGVGMSEDQKEEVGHWARGSSMPRHYDSAACVSELIAKNRIAAAMRRGWDVVPAGNVLHPEPEVPEPTPDAVFLSTLKQELATIADIGVHDPKVKKGTAVDKHTTTLCQHPGKSRIKVVKDLALLPTAVQVLHRGSMKVHLYSAGIASVCGVWTTGSVAEPAPLAEFSSSLYKWDGDPSVKFCRNCFRASLLKVFKEAAQANDENLGDDDEALIPEGDDDEEDDAAVEDAAMERDLDGIVLHPPALEGH